MPEQKTTPPDLGGLWMDVRDSELHRPTGELRWRGGKLQQQWLVEVRRGGGGLGRSVSVRHEWRDVPEVPADAE